MGSSGSGAVDCSVGSIVWVRRRNGSWWPGKILGPDELSATHLMSPRSGTPVKLLGREDASVDWYNLEKSKRVKAFRCGEFDDCIERAESSQGMPVKKREKYARREDAILHALELEKQLLEKKRGKLGISSDFKSSKLSDSMKKEIVTSFEGLGDENGKMGNAKPHQLSKGLDMSLKDEKRGNPLYAQKVKEGKQLSWDDDNSEAVPRMRGLQDFGLRIAPSKRKLSSSVALNGSRKPTVDDHAHAPSSGGVSMGNTSHVNGKNSVDKRKRSHEGLTEDTLVKRRDRRRPLVQVLQSSAKLAAPHSLKPHTSTLSLSVSGVDQTGNICRAKRSRCVYLPAESNDHLVYAEPVPSQMEISRSQSGEGNCHPLCGSLAEENTSGLMEDSESDSSETEDLEPDSDEETSALSDATVPTEADPKTVGGSEALGKHISMCSEEPDELASSGDMSHLHPHDPVCANAGVSKWQMKGKRNIRNLTKRSVDVTDVKGSNGSMDGAYLEERGSPMSQRALGPSLSFHHRTDDFNDGFDGPDLLEKDFRTQMGGFDKRGYSLNSKAASRGRNSISRDTIDWEDLAWEDQPPLKGYWKDTGECFDPVFVGRHQLGGRTKTMLVDVDLKVQASYQKEHVPIVSLMSRLNGKAIIGHPIQIEALEDSSSEILLSTKDDFGNDAFYNEGDTALPPVWRTARRTANYRVPRPHPSSALDGDEAAEYRPLLDHERKPPFKKLNTGGFSDKASLTRKSLPHIPRSPTEKKFPRKLPKKVSSSSSQKTRTLSSIAIEQKRSDKPKHDSDSYHMDGLIKQESGPTTVACIPVKLVFSRLYEAVGRSASTIAASHEVLMNRNTEKNQL
ncbi:hypothetical protein L1049_002667 [Liquidambar formosana]|uniref:PWWP domain-containing protein n=1 Tax=Liquidambar formosana TaxID=63359 RepID=A0AAP0R9D0_LIQFO